jgi:uncharacterized membrane protein YqjE
MIDGANTAPPDPSPRSPGPAADGADTDAAPARALTLHLLRMIETRMDAAGIAINTEVQTFGARMQLKLLAAATLFIAIWGGIVLLAIALPEQYRIPVLAAVVAAFVGVGIWALLASKREASPDKVGSMRWFLDGLKLDLEVLSRTLNRRHEPAPNAHSSTHHSSTEGSPPSDLTH